MLLLFACCSEGVVASAGEIQAAHPGAPGSDRPTGGPLGPGPRRAAQQRAQLRPLLGRQAPHMVPPQFFSRTCRHCRTTLAQNELENVGYDM